MTPSSLEHNRTRQRGGGGDKENLAEGLARQMRGSANPSVYRAYLALAFPDTGFTELEDEEKILKNMRKREKERLKSVTSTRT